MHPSISVLGLAAITLLDPWPRAEFQTGPKTPNTASDARAASARPAGERAEATPSPALPERGIQARAGSIQAQDEPSRGGAGDLRIERFVLEPSDERETPQVPAQPPGLGRDLRGGDRAPSSTSSNSATSAHPTLARSGGSKTIGTVEWRRLALSAGYQIECEILFARAARDLPCQRVLHVEELCDKGARLVWREMGEGSGRSMLVEWMPGGLALRTVEWDKNETLREEIAAPDGAVMPLYLIEILRLGRATTGRYLVFDPLARALVELELLTSYGDEPAENTLAPVLAAVEPTVSAGTGESAEAGRITGSRLRTVELLRADGSLAGRYRFRAAELVAFQWQEGGPWARRVSAREYEAALAELEQNGARDP